jgi:hypothetical protein
MGSIGMGAILNPDALNLAEAYFALPLVVQFGRLDVGVTGHVLGDVSQVS